MATSIPDLHATVKGSTARVRVEPCHRRLRVFVGGEAVADTTRALYLFETAHLPVYYFPVEDVRWEHLEQSDHTSHCPYKGDATYHHVVVGDQRRENAVWRYDQPIEECPDISGYVSFWWDRVDAWFEEDDEIFVHARDPYKRVDVLQSSRHVRVEIEGVEVANTTRPRLLFETGLPTRYYLPKLDVRWDLVRPSAKVTRCPYKGIANYVSVELPDGKLVEDIAWTYPAPIPEAPKLENHFAFFDEKVDVFVDGVQQERPATPWS